MLVINFKKEEMNKFCKRKRKQKSINSIYQIYAAPFHRLAWYQQHKYNLRIIKIFRQVNLNDPKPWVSHLKSEVKVFKVN